MELPGALSGQLSVSLLGEGPKEGAQPREGEGPREGAQPREEAVQQETRLSSLCQERSVLEERVREMTENLQQLSEERDALRVELDGQKKVQYELQAARGRVERKLESCLSESVQEEGLKTALVQRSEELEALVMSLREAKAKLSGQLEEKTASLLAQTALQADLMDEKEGLVAELAQMKQEYSVAVREAEVLREEVKAAAQSHKEVCAKNKELERSLSDVRVDLDCRSEELRQEQANTSVLRRTLEEQTESLDSLAAALDTLAEGVHTLGGSLCSAQLQDTKPPTVMDAKDVSSCVSFVCALSDEVGGLCRHAVALRTTLVEAEESNIDLHAQLEELEDEKRQAKEELEDERRKQEEARCGTAEVMAGLQGRVSELEHERDQLLREMEVNQVEVLEHLRLTSGQQQEMEEEKKRLKERIQHLEVSVREGEGQRDQLKVELEELEAKGKEAEKVLAERCQQHVQAVDNLTTARQKVTQLEACITEVEAARKELEILAQKDLAKLQAVEEEKASLEGRLKSKEAECALQLEQLVAHDILQVEKARLEQSGKDQTPVHTAEKGVVTKGQKASLCKTPSEEANLSQRTA